MVGAATLLWLFLISRLIDLSRIHTGLPSFNDQVGYISTARTLLKTGTLSSSIVYPSILLQTATKNYFYMPGHYLALAASYWLFGYGVWQSLLPNLVAYVLAAIGVYLIARRFYNRRVGLAAAGLFMLFAPNLVYAFSAMSEMTRVAATVLALAVFVYLPLRWQFLAGPWLAAVPFLFRETGAFLLSPMALFLYDKLKRRRLWLTAGFVVYGMVVLSLIYFSSLSAGRPSLMAANVFDNQNTTVYTDAFANQRVSSPTLGDWLHRIPSKVWESAVALVRTIITAPLDFLAMWTVILLVLALLSAIGAALWKDKFFLATAVLSLGHLVFLAALYETLGYDWLRSLLSVTPFLAIVGAAWVDRLIWPAHGRVTRVPNRIRWATVVGAAAGVALVSAVAVRHFFRPAVVLDAVDARRTAWLEQIGHDDSTMLVTPVIFFDYVNLHYPVTWAFIPGNVETLDLLAARYTIGTIVLPKGQDTFSPLALGQVGLVLEKTAQLEGTLYEIYQRPAPTNSALQN